MSEIHTSHESQNVPSYNEVLADIASRREAATAKASELEAQYGGTLDANQIIERRAARKSANEELAAVETEWEQYGGEAIDEAQAAVDSLNFKSDASERVAAQLALRDAKDAYYDNYLNANNDSEVTSVDEQGGEAEDADTGQTSDGKTEYIDTGSSESGREIESDEASLSAEEIRAKRAQMVQEGIPALDVGNMSDDEIAGYNLVVRPPEGAGEDASQSEPTVDKGAAATKRPIQPSIVITGNGDGPEASGGDTAVDMGDDIEELDESSADEGPRDEIMGMGTGSNEKQGRWKRLRYEAGRFMKNWRHPLAYLFARNQQAIHDRAKARANGEYKGNRRRAIIAGVVAGAALAGAGVAIWLRSQGHEVPTDGGGFVGHIPAPQGHEGDIILPAAETVHVNHGDGEIRVVQTVLKNHGISVDPTAAQHIGEYAGVDLLQADGNYNDALSTLNRVGGSAGEYQTQPGAAQALVDAARDLGY